MVFPFTLFSALTCLFLALVLSGGISCYAHAESPTERAPAGPGAAGVSETVRVAAAGVSSRVVYVGDPVRVHLTAENLSTQVLDASLTLELSDFHGKKTARVEKPFSLPPQEDRLLTFDPAPPGAGYFSVDVTVRAGGAVLLEQKTVWSIAVLERGAPVPANSPFGTYTIGNTVMLADIVPRGFYENMAQMGARWGTIDTWWLRLEPTEGKYDWVFYEEWFKAALAAGVVPIPHLFGVPRWISSRPDVDDYWAYPPRDWEVWERFVGDFVERYKDWLTYLRIWNEPNCGYWMGTPADYANLVIHAAQAAKRVKPDIQIIIEAVANRHLNVIRFFDAVDAAGATPYWDIIAIHNYWLNNRDYPERTPFVQVYRDFIGWRDAHKPGAEAWDSEFACMADDWDRTWVGVGETKQAQWLVRAHVLGFSLGLKKMFWFPGYSWPVPDSPPYYNPAGLLRVDLSPRPAYVAYHTTASMLCEARFHSALSLGADQYGRVFTTPSGFVTALWSVDAEHGGPLTLTFGKGETVVRTAIMGEQDSLVADPSSGALAVGVDENVIWLSSKTVPAVGAT